MEAIVGDSIGIHSPIPTKAPDSQPPVVEVAESFDVGARGSRCAYLKT